MITLVEVVQALNNYYGTFHYMNMMAVGTPVDLIYAFGVVEITFVLEMQHENRLFSVPTR
jgi:hypothetical protein